MKHFVLLFFCFLSSAAFAKKAPAPVFQDKFINIFFDVKQPVTFVGKKSLDVAGQAGAPIMYPGDTGAVFLVSILTHAAVSGAAQKAKLSKEQDEANKVLEPYASQIAKVDAKFLLQHTYLEDAAGEDSPLTLLFEENHSENSRWQVNVVPVFAMTQNQSSLLVFNKLTFVDRSLTPRQRKAKKVKKGMPDPNEKLVIIVSDPVLSDNKEDFWLKDDGDAFVDAVKSLYAQSFNMAIKRHFGALQHSDDRQVTIKYLENGVKKIERGYVISHSCQRTVFESLAGEIKSVPNLEFADCKSV